MRSSTSASIRSPAGRYAPAMALLEVLVAAAILAGVVLAFLSLLGESRADLARARQTSEAAALGRSLLREASTNWERVPSVGETDGLRWTRRCEASSSIRSERLVLVLCRIRIQSGGGAEIALDTAWAISRTDVLQP